MQSPQQRTAEQIPATADATLAYVVESVVPEAAVPSAAPTPVDALRQRKIVVSLRICFATFLAGVIGS